MLNIITLPSNAATELLSYAGTLFSNLWVLVAIAIGVPFGFYVVRKVIGLIPKR